MKRTIGPVTGITGAITALIGIIAWILSQYNIDIPAEIQAMVTTVCVFIAGFMVSPELTHKRLIQEIYPNETPDILLEELTADVDEYPYE